MSTRDRMLAELAELAEQLVEPHTHHAVVVDRSPQRNLVQRRAWTTRQDGLLAQLAAAAVEDTADGEQAPGGRSVPSSRPPGAWEALARHAAITIAVCRWCWELRISQRDTVEGNVRGLVGAAASVDELTLAAILGDVRGWHHQAAVMTGWADPAWAPAVPCPVCEVTGTVRVNVDRRIAVCVRDECGARWTADTIGVLAEYIRATTEYRGGQRVPVRSGRAGSGAWLPPGPGRVAS